MDKVGIRHSKYTSPLLEQEKSIATPLLPTSGLTPFHIVRRRYDTMPKSPVMRDEQLPIHLQQINATTNKDAYLTNDQGVLSERQTCRSYSVHSSRVVRWLDITPMLMQKGGRGLMMTRIIVLMTRIICIVVRKIGFSKI